MQELVEGELGLPEHGMQVDLLDAANPGSSSCFCHEKEGLTLGGTNGEKEK